MGISLICRDLYPTCIMNAHLQDLLKMADPSMSCPARSSAAMPSQGSMVRSGQGACPRPLMHISTNTWRSNNQNLTYITLAVHFLSSVFPNCLSVSSRCLKTSEVPEENTA